MQDKRNLERRSVDPLLNEILRKLNAQDEAPKVHREKMDDFFRDFLPMIREIKSERDEWHEIMKALKRKGIMVAIGVFALGALAGFKSGWHTAWSSLLK